jgi:hypothetical protein
LALLAGILTYDFGYLIYDSPKFYTVSYGSWKDAFVTFMFLQTVNNSPDVIVQMREYMFLLSFFYVGSTVINVILLKSITLAIVNEGYRKTLLEDLEILQGNNKVVQVLEKIQDTGFKAANLKHVEKMLGKQGTTLSVISNGMRGTILGGQNDEPELLNVNRPTNEIDLPHQFQVRKSLPSRDTLMKKKENKLFLAFRFLLFVCRVLILISPVVTLDIAPDNSSSSAEERANKTIYIVNLVAALILAFTWLYYLRQKGVRYLRFIQSGVEIVVCVALVLFDLQMIFIAQAETIPEVFFTWAFFCLLTLTNLVDQMRTFRMVRQSIIIIAHAFNTVSPFIFVIVMNYMIFAFLGQILFGGKINSDTPQNYLIATGSTIFRRYQHLNFNDYYNSITILYAIQLNNQLPTLLNICTCARDPNNRDNSGLFFLVFVMINNMILFNIFIGNLISICLEYFQKEKETARYLESMAHLSHGVDAPKVHLSAVGTVMAGFNFNASTLK